MKGRTGKHTALLEEISTLKERVMELERAEAERIHAEKALSESESIQRILLENLPAGVMIIDPATRMIESVNAAATELFGEEEKNIIGHRCHTFICPAAEGACPVCDLGKEVDHSEREMIRHDGTIRPVLKSVRRITIQGQSKLLESFVDITEQKRTEGELKASFARVRQGEEILSAAITATNESLIMIDREGIILLANRTVAKRLGKTVKKLVGTYLYDHFSPDVAAVRKKNIDRVFTTGHPEHFEDMRAGMYFEHRLYPVLDETGQVTRVVNFATEVTKRKEAEAALRESEEILRSMVEATSEALLVTDRDGTILLANEILAARMGKHIRDIIGTSQYDHYPPYVAERRKQRFDEVVRTGRPVHFEDVRSIRILDIFAYPIFDESGQVAKIAIFSQDITKRKNLEIDRERLIAELKEALSQVKTLSGFVPICSTCKKVRNDEGYWEQLEKYISENTNAELSHGICPDCARKLYPEYCRTG